jgi:hypothetical protein
MTSAPFVPACVTLGIVRTPTGRAAANWQVRRVFGLVAAGSQPVHDRAAMQVHACQSTPVAEPIRYRSKANVALQVQAQGFCALPDLQNAADGDSPGIQSAPAQPENPTQSA